MHFATGSAAGTVKLTWVSARIKIFTMLTMSVYDGWRWRGWELRGGQIISQTKLNFTEYDSKKQDIPALFCSYHRIFLPLEIQTNSIKVERKFQFFSYWTLNFSSQDNMCVVSVENFQIQWWLWWEKVCPVDSIETQHPTHFHFQWMIEAFEETPRGSFLYFFLLSNLRSCLINTFVRARVHHNIFNKRSWSW